ncbi:MAG: hypothetical protein Tsb0019_28800 [Roseibium sp.]
MRRFLMVLILSILPFPIASSWAQEAVREPVEVGASGEAYLKALRFRRIETDVAYFDPAGPVPDLKTGQRPDRQPETDAGPLEIKADWIVVAVAAALLAGLLYVFVRFGGRLSVSLGRDADNPSRGRSKDGHEAPAWAERLGTLDDILRTGDRRRALVLLARKTLAATVSANGVLMQKSWTARDALKHIPETQLNLSALKNVVMASERVQFGGRDISEDDFRIHVDACRPLLGTTS